MYHVLVAGGDKRNIYLAEVFNRDGFNVSVCGFDESAGFDNNIEQISDIKKETKKFDIIILPLPVSSDNITINTPFSHECIYIQDILNCAGKDAVITGGRVGASFAERYGNHIVDYTARDDFAYLNAVPTAEGAIEAAMKASAGTIAHSKCMVTGFGRCSEILAHTLRAMNAEVHVFARSAKDLSHAEALGFKSIHLDKLSQSVADYDMIFNSVPFGIFGSECTEKIKPSCVFIDIASAPGGISPDAHKTKINYNFLPGLPGKYSPYTAALIIKKVILTIMHESGKDAHEWLLKD